MASFPLLRESHKESHLFGVLMKQKKIDVILRTKKVWEVL